MCGIPTSGKAFEEALASFSFAERNGEKKGKNPQSFPFAEVSAELASCLYLRPHLHGKLPAP